MPYILDTCIFNKLLDGIISINDLPSDDPFFATYIQINELRATKNIARRDNLLLKFEEIVHPAILPTETFLTGLSRLDHDKLGDGILFGKLKASLNSRNNSKPNNTQDALIAETAKMNNFTLITSDKDLAAVATEHGCSTIHLPI